MALVVKVVCRNDLLVVYQHPDWGRHGVNKSSTWEMLVKNFLKKCRISNLIEYKNIWGYSLKTSRTHESQQIICQILKMTLREFFSCDYFWTNSEVVMKWLHFCMQKCVLDWNMKPLSYVVDQNIWKSSFSYICNRVVNLWTCTWSELRQTCTFPKCYVWEIVAQLLGQSNVVLYRLFF